VHVEIYSTGTNGSPVGVSKLIVTAIICVKMRLKKRTSEKKKGKNTNYLITL
jgi:hypothetical protein